MNDLKNLDNAHMFIFSDKDVCRGLIMSLKNARKFNYRLFEQMFNVKLVKITNSKDVMLQMKNIKSFSRFIEEQEMR